LSVLAAGCGKITTTSTAGTIATLPTTTGDYYWNPKPLLYDITSGPNRNLWFTDYNENQICKISSQTGVITGYAIPTTVADPTAITVGPDGNLWFTEFDGNKIGKIAPQTGIVTEYDVPIANAQPTAITAGPDGNLWFTEFDGNKIGKISPKTGIITEYDANQIGISLTPGFNTDTNLPTSNAYPFYNITAGTDGNIWFVEGGGNSIGKISPKTGVVTQYDIPTANADLGGIIAGPDGNIWF